MGKKLTATSEEGRLSAFEREALGKALEIAASAGAWDKAGALLSKLGEAAWARPALMGESPQRKALDRAWSLGEAPPSDWQEARRDAPGAFEEMEARAFDLARRGAASRDAGRAALGWLARSAPRNRSPFGLAFDGWRADGSEAGAKKLDLSEWARALAERAREGSLDASWRDCRGLWAMRADLAAGPAADAFDDALAKAGLLPPILAASMGCEGTAQRAIKSLAPEKALAALAARLSESAGDWAAFEALAPSPGASGGNGAGSDLSWRDLACEGEQRADLDFMENFAHPVWGSRTWASAAGYKGEALARKAIGALARRAAPLLSGADAGSLAMRAWVAARAPAEVATELSPRGSDYDLSAYSREEVFEAIEQARELDSPELAGLGRAAAERLWGLREPSAEPFKNASGFDKAAGGLWRAAAPEAFEAYARRLSELCGAAGEAAYLCGLPEPLLRREFENQPGSPGHLVALGRAFPPGCLTLDGADRWGESHGGPSGWAFELRRSLGVSHLARSLDAGELGGWMGAPPPEPLPPIESWGEVDLRESRWRAGAQGADVSAGFEGALEALCELALRGDPEHSEPDRPATGGNEDAPSRLAWRRYAQARPQRCAELLAERWTSGEFEGREATLVAEFLAPEQKAAVARELPAAIQAAFEKFGAIRGSGGSSRAAPRAHEASRKAAQALASASEAAFDERDRLCAACMAASAYGIGLALGARSGSLEHWDKALLADSAKGLREHLPRAALLLGSSDVDEPRAEGFGGADLAAKAAWGALALESAAPGRGSWGALWEDVAIDPRTSQARALLSAMFTPAALERRAGPGLESLAAEAHAWASRQGADGFGRLEGREGARSALELAVDCRVERKWRDEDASSFGPGICQALVGMGADPSAADAPRGDDAMALCAKLHRRESPSKSMKALMGSPLAKPGRGALWSILADSSKAKLSEKLSDELRARARFEPEMSGLARLAEGSGEFDAGARRELERALTESPRVRELAGSGLLGAMARHGASSTRCEDAGGKMRAVGVEPTERDARDMAVHGLLREARKAGARSTNFASEARLWARAGAWGGPLDAAGVPDEIAAICREEGLGDAPAAGAICVALAARAWRGKDQGATTQLLLGVAELHEAGLGSPDLSRALAPLLVAIQKEGRSAKLVSMMGSGAWERLEAVALAAEASKKRPAASKRI